MTARVGCRAATLAGDGYHDGPIIPMPPLTRDALREAVKRLSLVNLAQFDLEAGRAFDQVSQTGSTAPLQLFLRRWGVFVAIERDPARAARLQEAEQISQDSTVGEAAFRAAMAEINGILREAEQEIGV